MANPILYEINTRVWRHRFGEDTRLLDIPFAYWQQLAALGVEYVWLMGVWQTGPNVLHYALESGLQEAYRQALPDWTERDIIGSPYAIDRYVLHPDLGLPEDLPLLRQRLNDCGLRLLLDFVPNHFHAESGYVSSHPDVFLEVSQDALEKDSHTFYQPPGLGGRVFAHGKDPWFAAWQDTAQVNYTHPAAQAFMLEQLLHIAAQCDGVRCDMAMLPLPQVMAQTWGAYLGAASGQTPAFWPKAIQTVRSQHPGFLFLAEVYWDMEWQLQQMGFDYTYDKRLRDRLSHTDAEGVRNHLLAERAFQERSTRFLENHDEERSLRELNISQAQAAALIAYTVPGMRFFYQGQWEGRRIRLPVQLGREPLETSTSSHGLALSGIPLAKLTRLQSVVPSMTAFYDFLLQLLRESLLQEGQWVLLPAQHPSHIAWQWVLDGQRVYIGVNYGNQPFAIQLPPSVSGWRAYLTSQPIDATVFLVAFEWVVAVDTL
ncbi:MAG: alpha-amylase family glycosyl hydrolase [Saprospiraceae bacterium]